LTARKEDFRLTTSVGVADALAATLRRQRFLAGPAGGIKAVFGCSGKISGARTG
jgi:hypothetical protein